MRQSIRQLLDGIYGSGGGQPVPSFMLNLAREGSIIPEKGSSTITNTRATTARVSDQDGIIRTALAGEMRMGGFRRVANKLTVSSENFGAAPWTDLGGNITKTGGQTDPKGGTAAWLLAPSGNASLYSLVTTALPIAGAGVGSIWLRSATGSNVSMAIAFNGAGVNPNPTTQAITVTTTWQRFSVPLVGAAASGSINLILGDLGAAWGAGENIYAYGAQLEDVTGQSIQTPGEYVSVGVLSAPWHGAGVDGVRYFPWTNGNTVASNVVTEATGAAISSSILQGLLIEPLATNLCLQSNAFTTTWTAVGTPAATQNVVGPDGIANSAWTLTDNSAVAIESVYQNITLTAAVYTASIHVKKTTGAQASYPLVYVTDNVNTIAAATIDTSNGTATIWTAYTGFANPIGTAICESIGDFWKVSITFTGTAAAWSMLVAPAATANATQSTGAPDAAVQGTAVFFGAQVELGSRATSYIPTTTVSVTRNADLLHYSLGTWYNPAGGALYAEWMNPSVSGSYVAASFNDATGNNNMGIYATTVTTANADCNTSTVLQSHLSAVSITGGAVAKCLGIFMSNDFAAFANNTSLGTDVSGTIPVITRLELGSQTGLFSLNGYIRKIMYYPYRLSNAAAQNLTV